MSREDNKEANAIVEAVRVYHNYFIPVHEDGRTASEFAGETPPGWLSALIAEHRETRLTSSEERMVRDDPMLFIGKLAAEVLGDIVEEGGTTKRSKVVLMIMDALADSRRRVELEAAERTSRARVGKGIKAGPGAAVSAVAGQDEGEDEGPPKVVIPFVTVYSTKKKARTRALLQTYREGALTVSFHGVECKVTIDQSGEDIHVFDVYSSYPLKGGGKEEDNAGAGLGVIRLDGEYVELSSTVEERHRALRDFFLKLVGEKNVKVVSVMEDAVVDQRSGELVDSDLEDALSIMDEMTPGEILKEGLVVALAAGILTHGATNEGDEKKEEEEGDVPTLRPSSTFIGAILQSYRELVAARPHLSKGEALGGIIFSTAFEALQAAREGLNDDDDGVSGTAALETTVSVIAFLAVMDDLAREDGEKVAVTAIDRIATQKSLKEAHVRGLLGYLERFAAAGESQTTRKDGGIDPVGSS